MDVSSQSTIYSVGEDTAPQVPTDRPLQPPAYVAEDLPPSYDEAMRQKTQDTWQHRSPVDRTEKRTLSLE